MNIYLHHMHEIHQSQILSRQYRTIQSASSMRAREVQKNTARMEEMRSIQRRVKQRRQHYMMYQQGKKDLAKRCFEERRKKRDPTYPADECLNTPTTEDELAKFVQQQQDIQSTHSLQTPVNGPERMKPDTPSVDDDPNGNEQKADEEAHSTQYVADVLDKQGSLDTTSCNAMLQQMTLRGGHLDLKCPDSDRGRGRTRSEDSRRSRRRKHVQPTPSLESLERKKSRCDDLFFVWASHLLTPNALEEDLCSPSSSIGISPIGPLLRKRKRVAISPDTEIPHPSTDEVSKAPVRIHGKRVLSNPVT